MLLLGVIESVLIGTHAGAVLRLAGLVGAAGAGLLLIGMLWPRQVLGDDLAFLFTRLPLLQRLSAMRGAGV
jgi:hypothetical protein